jgi:hypothetical protein
MQPAALVSASGWPSAKRPRDLAFCAPTPGAVAPPTRRLRNGVARRRAWRRRAGPAGRRIFSSCPCSPPFKAAMHASSAAARARSGAGIPSRSSTARWPLWSGPLAVRALVRPAVSSERASLMRCPGSGPGVRSSGSRCGTVAPVLPRTSARQPELIAGGEGAVAFGACSRRTSGSPRLLLLSGRS